MATTVVVPPIGESITSVTLLSWEKKVGDEVAMGDILGELETDKSAVPLECPAKGVVVAILVEEGETVEIGAPLVVIGKPGESWSPAPAEDRIADVAAAAKGPGDKMAAGETSPQVVVPQVKAAPSARRLARELGIDIALVSAHIGGRRVTETHVREFSGADSAGIPGHPVKFSRIRRVVAERMMESARTIPQFSVSIRVDATQLQRARSAAKAEGTSTSLTAYLVWAAAESLGEHPAVHSRYHDEDAAYAFDECNIAVAVDTAYGLVAPVLHSVRLQTPDELSGRLTELVAKAREGTLGREEQSNATFTISNLGTLGADRFTPMVVPGQGAILGIGAIQAVPVATNDRRVEWKQVFEVTLTADHRVTDGAEATRFLTTFKDRVEALQ